MLEREWVCANPDCRIETVLISETESEISPPNCICGAALKKCYTPPCLKSLEGKELESAKELFPLTSAS